MEVLEIRILHSVLQAPKCLRGVHGDDFLKAKSHHLNGGFG
jgi:hypothetical protein